MAGFAVKPVAVTRFRGRVVPLGPVLVAVEDKRLGKPLTLKVMERAIDGGLVKLSFDGVMDQLDSFFETIENSKPYQDKTPPRGQQTHEPRGTA